MPPVRQQIIVLQSIVLIILCSLNASAQWRQLEKHTSIALSVGGTFGYARWTFRGKPDVPVRPDVAVMAELAYGPLVHTLGTLQYPSLEIGHGEQYAYTYTDSGKAHWAIQREPIMVWWNIITESKLSPFVRVGIGISKTDFREEYSYNSLYGIRFHDWAFTWGVGAGLNYSFSERFDLALLIEDWITEQKFLEKNPLGHVRGISGHFTVTIVALKGTYHL